MPTRDTCTHPGEPDALSVSPPIVRQSAVGGTIPKTFHHIWLGGRPPQTVRDMIDTWRRHHRTWEFRLWTERDLPEMPRLGPYFHAAEAYAVKADMVRLEAVFACGGVYVDTDVECLQPIDDLLAGCRCFAACEYDAATYGLSGPSGIGNDIFGAAPGHPAILDVIQQVPNVFNLANPLAHGPGLFRHVMHARPDVRIFEKDIFHPLLPHQARSGDRVAGAQFPGAYAVHWFNLSWAK
ncbi:hypothetical protein LCGC14_0095110 [marine sediment metagenome]|uniref:Glycosyl transferase n=1 Tax=marine sediment metagenome TaxID=412755 RepID=A0A0F9YGP6_9ZZZZ|nr:hypothetical protein [Phycisphaerae bacterium]HDZ43171.1 hypothetical protein [Phycisphaerae bacterium]